MHVDLPSKRGNTALHWASKQGQQDVVELLIQQGAALRKVERVERVPPPENPLLAAIKRGGALRKVDAPAKPKAQHRPTTGLFGNEVDKILALRAKIGAESDSSSDSDWDSSDDSD